MKEAPSRLFLKFHLDTQGLWRIWVGMLIGVGHRNVLIVGLVRSWLSMFFLSVHRMITRDNFWTTSSKFLIQILLILLFVIAFLTKLFCLGEKQGGK